MTAALIMMSTTISNENAFWLAVSVAWQAAAQLQDGYFGSSVVAVELPLCRVEQSTPPVVPPRMLVPINQTPVSYTHLTLPTTPYV